MAKRKDKTPKPTLPKRGVDKGQIGVARARGIDTSTNAGAEQISPDKPLTEKQRLFVKYWAEGEPITSASKRAGYNDGATIAYRMVKMPNVLRLYNKLKQQYEEASQMSRKKVMDGLLEAVEMAKLMSEPATMVSGWREIGKMCGYYAPVEQKISIDVTGNVVMNRLNSLSDAELLKIITQGAANASTPTLGYDEGVGEDDE